MLRKLNTGVPRVYPQKYVSKFVSKLTLSGDTETIALRIVELATEMKLTSGRGPAGIAAAATYVASVLTNERRTQGEFAQTGKITEVTIRNRYKELVRMIQISFDL